LPDLRLPEVWRIIERIGALWQRVRLAAAIRCERFDLAELDDRMLRDLGERYTAILKTLFEK
jgi:uncharacterized protein YjiS (DUF1127 family)